MRQVRQAVILVLVMLVISSGYGQTATAFQLKQADDELNQLYKAVMGTLDNKQRMQLRDAQRKWINVRDDWIANNPLDPISANYQATTERIRELKTLIQTIDVTTPITPPNIQSVNNARTNTLGDLCNKLITNKVKESRVAALVKFDSEIGNKDKENAKPENIIDTVYKLNNAEEIGKAESTRNLSTEISPIYNDSTIDKLTQNLAKAWPRENNSNWISIWNRPSAVLQHKCLNQVVSEAHSSNLIARSYKDDPAVYIYDNHNNTELLTINTDNFYNWNRDMGITPRELLFSKDGKYLVLAKHTGGYAAPNIYIINTCSWEIIKPTNNLFPIFIKDFIGNIRLQSYDSKELNNTNYLALMRLSNGNRLYSYHELQSFNEQDSTILQKIKNRYADELKQLDIKDDQIVIPNQSDHYIQPSDTQGDLNFVINWPYFWSSNNISINIETLRSQITDKKYVSSLIVKAPEYSPLSNQIPIPCFWGFLADVQHDCTDEDCRKNVTIPKVFCTLNNRWIIPQYISDIGQQPSGWQRGSGIGVFDTLKKKWLALPALRVKWSTVWLSDGRKWYTEKVGKAKLFGKTLEFGPAPVEQKRFPHILLGENEELSDYLPLCLPPILGAPNDLTRHVFFDKRKNLLWVSTLYEGLQCIDLNSGTMPIVIWGIPSFQSFCVTEKYIIGIPQIKNATIEIWSRTSLKKISDIFLAEDGGSIFAAPDGAYASNTHDKNFVAFRSGNCGFPLDQFDLRLNRPDIVLERLGAPKEAIETAKSLREKRLKRMGVTEEMLKPDFHLPELQIVADVPASTSKDQLDLQIKASDDKYPLDRLRVYVNNVPVNGRDGELLRDQKTQSLEKTIPIKLAAGRNKIQVSVLNSAGAESLYANAEVNCTADRLKPKLYAVALGVSQYDRAEWCLKYAAKDATELINKLQAKAGSSYSEVKPLLLTDKEVTKESATKIMEFLSTATIDDTVLIFMAGHGLLDDKYDYYFGTTDIDPAKPSERGMAYEAIDTILAEVPSLKKALLMDTCHAGELDDDEKKDLAASDGSATPAAIPAAATNSSPMAGKVAMRAIGTRGMQVKAVEGAKGKSDWYEKLQDMFVDLRRGSGATVISSSQGAEYAFESSEQSNGLFTYSLMEALDGKATPNKDGEITISSIGDYVKKRVQDLTKGKQNPNLRGVNLEEDFALSSTK